MKQHLGPAAAAIVAVAAAVFAAPLGAAPVVTISNPVVTGGTGYFDVVISNPGGGEQVSGYTIGLNVTRTSGTGGITLNDAVEPTNALFPGSDPGSGYFEPQNVFYATDALTGGSAAATDGKRIFRAVFALQPNTSSTVFNVDFFQSSNHPLDSRLEAFANNETSRVPATFTGRSIVVPEPAGAVVLLPAATALLARRRRRLLS